MSPAVPASVPRHLAVIMDGNGRWARQRRLPRVEGHRAGIASVRATVETAARLELTALTLYAFSPENWKRPHLEVATLMAERKAGSVVIEHGDDQGPAVLDELARAGFGDQAGHLDLSGRPRFVTGRRVSGWDGE